MSVEVLELDGRVSAFKSWTPSAGTTVACLTDESDATWSRSNTPKRRCVFSCVDPGAVTGELVSVCPYVRSKKDGTMRAAAIVCTYYAGQILSTGIELRMPHEAVAADHEIAAHRGCHDLGSIAVFHRVTGWRIVEFTADDAALGLVDTSGAANRAYVYEAGLKAYYLEPPTIDSPTAPTGTISDTQMPECEVDVSCIVEEWQVPADESPWLADGTVDVRIYADADVPGGSTTPPPLATPVWSTLVRFIEATYGDGETPSEQTVAATPDVPLPNGDYWIFTRVSRDLPSGAERFYSDWSYGEFVMDIDLPNTPAVAGTADDDEQRVDLTVTATTTAGYEDDTYEASVERSDDGGLSWTKVRACQDVAITLGVTEIGSDYEAPRAASVTYRARVSAALTSDGTRLWSDWDEADVATHACTGWNLKLPEQPTLSWIGAPVKVTPEAERDQVVNVFHPLDRDGAVALSEPMSGETGSFTIHAKGAAEIASLAAIVAWESALYLENPFGEARYIRATGAGWSLEGTAGSPRRRASLEYVEIGAPAVS